MALTWTQANQDTMIGLIRELDQVDQWKFPVEIRKGLRDFTRAELDLYDTLSRKWTRKKRAEQIALLKRLPEDIQMEFAYDIKTGQRPMSSIEMGRLRAYIDSGYLDDYEEG